LSNEDSDDHDDVHSIIKNSHLSFFNHNKENILIKKKSNVKKLIPTNVESAESFITKMPPVKLTTGRQTNNSLSSITGNIVPVLLPASIVPPAVTNTNTSSSSSSSAPPRKKVSAKAEL
jgi:hypothetical protein